MRGFPVVLHRHILAASMAMVSILPVIQAQTSGADYPAVTVQATAPPEFDWAKLGSGSRVLYVSSGMRVLADRMVDDNMGTIFRFPASDLHPTVIVELAQAQLLHRVGAAFKAQDARLDIFLLNSLPKDVADLQSVKPFGSIVDSQSGNEALDFAPSNAHYVVFRWTRTNSNGPFEVAEISAVSAEPPETTLAAFAGGQMHFAHEGGQDFSNDLGTTADPPVIAAVSP
jgi:hypothetical protein